MPLSVGECLLQRACAGLSKNLRIKKASALEELEMGLNRYNGHCVRGAGESVGFEVIAPRIPTSIIAQLWPSVVLNFLKKLDEFAFRGCLPDGRFEDQAC